MGDKVQAELENLLPTLLELNSKSIFSEKEVRKIIKKRRDFEYRLIGSDETTKRAFLDYIHYEIALETLRKHRIEAQISIRDNEHRLSLKTARTTSGIPHILRLFKRGVRRWPQDVRLWNQYVAFCLRSGSSKTAMAVLMQALAQHPREVHFWLIAADRELQLGHLEAPRRLFQLGLRQLPDCRQLWQEYLRFECHCVHKLAAVKTADSLMCESDDKEISSIIGVQHVGVLIKGALQKLSNSESDRFLAFALDLFAQLMVVGNRHNGSVLQGVDALEQDLLKALESRASERPLIGLLLWKLQALDAAGHTSLHLGEALSALEKRVIQTPEEWCCVLLLLYNLIQTGYAEPLKIISTTPTPCVKPETEGADALPLFSLNSSGVSLLHDTEQNSSLSPRDASGGDGSFVCETEKQSAVTLNTPFSEALPAVLVTFLASHYELLQRCLVLPVAAKGPPSPISPHQHLSINNERFFDVFKVIEQHAPSDVIQDPVTLKQLETETALLSQSLLDLHKTHALQGPSVSVVRTITLWAVRNTLARASSEWPVTLPLLFKLIHCVVALLNPFNNDSASEQFRSDFEQNILSYSHSVLAYPLVAQLSFSVFQEQLQWLCLSRPAHFNEFFEEIPKQSPSYKAQRHPLQKLLHAYRCVGTASERAPVHCLFAVQKLLAAHAGSFWKEKSQASHFRANPHSTIDCTMQRRERLEDSDLESTSDSSSLSEAKTQRACERLGTALVTKMEPHSVDITDWTTVCCTETQYRVSELHRRLTKWIDGLYAATAWSFLLPCVQSTFNILLDATTKADIDAALALMLLEWRRVNTRNRTEIFGVKLLPKERELVRRATYGPLLDCQIQYLLRRLEAYELEASAVTAQLHRCVEAFEDFLDTLSTYDASHSFADKEYNQFPEPLCLPSFFDRYLRLLRCVVLLESDVVTTHISAKMPLSTPHSLHLALEHHVQRRFGALFNHKNQTLRSRLMQSVTSCAPLAATSVPSANTPVAAVHDILQSELQHFQKMQGNGNHNGF